jgi:arsenate reductase
VQIRIIGSAKSKDTRKAERFFRERGFRPHLLDVRRNKVAPGELKRFVRKFGHESLVNVEGNEYERKGLFYLKLSEKDLLELLVGEPVLLVQPLVAADGTLALGWDETFWRAWDKDRMAGP